MLTYVHTHANMLTHMLAHTHIHTEAGGRQRDRPGERETDEYPASMVHVWPAISKHQGKLVPGLV